MSAAPRPARAFDALLGSTLDWARSGPLDECGWLLLCFEEAGIVRLEGAADGVSLACNAVEAVPPQVRPRETAFDACLGRALLAVTPRTAEYESEADELGPSGVCLEFEGGRRVCVRHVGGELVIDRTGRTGGVGRPASTGDQSLAG